METDIIWLLLFIGYAIGLIPIAYFGITGTWEMIELQNKNKKAKKELTIINGYNRIRYINQYRRII